MKFFLTIVLLLMITFTGCAQKNAFQRFGLTNSQELAEDNLQSSKVVNKEEKVVAVVTAVYLNRIKQDINKGHEYFYIYLYAKNKSDKIDFYLNNMSALLVKELPVQNEFTEFTSFDSKWNRYYLVSFLKQQQKTLHLKIQLGQNSTTITFKH